MNTDVVKSQSKMSIRLAMKTFHFVKIHSMTGRLNLTEQNVKFPPDIGTFRRTFSDELKKKLNSMVRVRERTIPTERLPLVGEVIANLC
jgi:hypothetical protein